MSGTQPPADEVGELMERMAGRRKRLALYYEQAGRDGQNPNPGTLGCIIDVLQHIDRDQADLIERQATELAAAFEEMRKAREELARILNS